MHLKSGLITVVIIMLTSCQQSSIKNKNLHFKMENLAKHDLSGKSFHETVYVPVYTDVYHVDQSRLFPLTITLSLRNTSLSDTLYIYKVNYHNSNGQEIKQHIKDDDMLILNPLKSYELVIDKKTYSGDTGANFIVKYAGNKAENHLLVQALMISTSGQQGLSFITTGKIIH